ncbi:MAG: hypothetical protein Q8P99_01715 [bacterium]|nr:hypothetical protein [bacterium]MDZ4231275.1 hypothetical protein [Patescibacteria group bacterium]
MTNFVLLVVEGVKEPSSDFGLWFGAGVGGFLVIFGLLAWFSHERPPEK